MPGAFLHVVIYGQSVLATCGAIKGRCSSRRRVENDEEGTLEGFMHIPFFLLVGEHQAIQYTAQFPQHMFPYILRCAKCQ